MITTRDILLFLLGLNAGCFGVRGYNAGKRWIWRILNERHAKVCDPLNVKWKRRVVRHPLTGRVGICVGVCTQEHGWRDMLFPRWEAGVMFSAEMARLQETRPESVQEFLQNGMRLQMLGQSGGFQKVLLKELALAPASDVAEFQRQKEQA